MFAKEEHDGEVGGNNEIIGFIGKGMRVEGSIHFEGTVRIDGEFKGDVDTKGRIVVGDSAQVEAQLKVDTAIVSGEIRGVIEATKRVELKAPGKVFGDIKTPTLIIGEGVIFEGNCVMTKKDGSYKAPEPVKTEEKKESGNEDNRPEIA